MANSLIVLDTSILIDYYRKTNKENSTLIALLRSNYQFAISVVTKYEILAGATEVQLSFWNMFLQSVSILSFDETSTNTAIEVNKLLKKKRKQIDIADLFIASTAISNKLPLATLNKKHFERIDELKIVEIL